MHVGEAKALGCELHDVRRWLLLLLLLLLLRAALSVQFSVRSVVDNKRESCRCRLHQMLRLQLRAHAEVGEDLGFRVNGLGFRIWALRFRP